MVKIAIVIYSTYGHVLTLSKAEAEGAKAAGAEVDVYQLPTAEQNDASAAAGLPVITPSKLAEYDGVLFGIPSRYGTHPYAFKAFFDATGAQWASGAYHGKYAGFFVSTGTLGGGQETVARNSVTILAHHGFIYVPLGYARAFGEITSFEEVHGGSPWGAGTLAGPSGARQPSKLELDTARIQGKAFVETVAKGTGESTTSKGTSSGAAVAAGAGGAGAAGAAGASGAAGSKTGAAGASGASGAQAAAKDGVSRAEGAASEGKNEATSAPKKAQQEASSSANKAEAEAEKEKSGCCKCM